MVANFGPKKCGYGEAYDHHVINSVTQSAGNESLLAIQNSLEGVPITKINVANFNTAAVNLPSAYSAPTIKGLFTKVPSGYALVSNITFGSKTVQFMAVDGKGLSENQVANPIYISIKVNTRIMKPIVFPTLTNLTKNQKTMIDAYAGSIWYAMFIWELTGRVGIFDTSHVYLSVVNVTMDNAFWNGYYMVYGIGYGTIDVVGHETSHGIIQSLGGLDYASEPGALNESIADKFGICFEKYYDLKNNKNLFDWTMGEDVYNGGFRSFSNPKINGQPNLYMGRYWKNTANPNENNDYGGVHTNSGVPNFFFYLTVNGTRGTAYNDSKVAYNIKTPVSMFALCKLIYLSLKGENGYIKITPLTNFCQYASILVQNTPKFLISDKTLPKDFQNTILEAFIATGILKRGAPLPSLPGAVAKNNKKITKARMTTSKKHYWVIAFLVILVILFLFLKLNRVV